MLSGNPPSWQKSTNPPGLTTENSRISTTDAKMQIQKGGAMGTQRASKLKKSTSLRVGWQRSPKVGFHRSPVAFCCFTVQTRVSSARPAIMMRFSKNQKIGAAPIPMLLILQEKKIVQSQKLYQRETANPKTAPTNRTRICTCLQRHVRSREFKKRY